MLGVVDEELTGHDEQGHPVHGHRHVSASDAGESLDIPIDATVAVDGPLLQLLGGPLDGFMVKLAETPTRDLELLKIVDAKGEPSDEMYLARPLGDEWWGVHASLLQAVVRSDAVHIKDPDPAELRLRVKAVFGDDAELAIPVCEPGQHRWTPWRATDKGNKTRLCVICQLGQGSVL
jgi:hypothetical protein